MEIISNSFRKIKFKINNYPDGQQDLEILEMVSEDYYCIVSNFNSFLDLELIICATKALRRAGVKSIQLSIPYLLGARCDRQFKKGGTSYLRDVVAPILNAQDYVAVRVYDAHNIAVADACINNLHVDSNKSLVEFAIKEIGNTFDIVSPDEGASKKIYSLCKEIGYTGDVVVCSKKRDTESGEIVETNIGNVIDFKGSDVVIIDDICDGGRTFIEIAKKIKLLNCGNLYLIVSHGIFSKGFEELSQYFEKIFCTNSVSIINNPIVKQFNLI